MRDKREIWGVVRAYPITGEEDGIVVRLGANLFTLEFGHLATLWQGDLIQRWGVTIQLM